MKKALILIILIAAVAFYMLTKSDDQQTVVYQNNEEPEKAKVEKIETPEPAQTFSEKPPGPNSGNASPETGWSAFPGPSEPSPKIDINAQINVGNGSGDIKTISAKQGQRVSIMFTANIRDLVKIEGYTAETYIEPQRESTIGFNVNKSGNFSITLAKLNKTIAILNVE